jgi:hypothetical protein
MKSLLLAGASLIAAGNVAFAQGYWVTGNRASGKCEIVTSNPVINSQVRGSVTFGSGPYRSNDDAKLARSTIRECPPEPPDEARDADKADKND